MQCTLKVENFETEINLDPSTVFGITVDEFFRRGGDAWLLVKHDLRKLCKSPPDLS